MIVEQSKWNRDGRQWWISDSSTIMMEQLKWKSDGRTPSVEQR